MEWSLDLGVRVGVVSVCRSGEVKVLVGADEVVKNVNWSG